MIIVNNIVLHTGHVLREQVSSTLITKTDKKALGGDGYVNQLDYNNHFTIYICIAKHNVVYLKYNFYFKKYNIKTKNKKKRKPMERRQIVISISVGSREVKKIKKKRNSIWG